MQFAPQNPLVSSDFSTKQKVTHLWKVLTVGIACAANLFVLLAIYSYQANLKTAVATELKPFIEKLEVEFRKESAARDKVLALEIQALQTRLDKVERDGKDNEAKTDKDYREIIASLHRLELLIQGQHDKRDARAAN